MKLNLAHYFYFIFIIVIFNSCQEKQERITEADLLFSSLQTDQKKWWSYHQMNIDLSSNFIALGESGDSISKKEFLEQLITGQYIAIEIRNKTSGEQYRLFRLNENADEAIEYTVASDAYRQYKHFMSEGKDFPSFTFEDLDGKTYSKDALLGKILVIKTWFLKCKPCIEEMPQLNNLVADYSSSKEVVFLSLSTDPKNELEEFLKKTEFNYPVVADTKAFVEDTLGFNIYPTHLIVDRKGKIHKVVNTAPEMIAELQELTEKATTGK